MKAKDIRRRYLSFFEKNGHVIIPSAPVIPENDPTTLFTGSGMQPLVPYLLGQPHPEGTRLTNSQKSFRAEDIEDVGDNRHTTMFEMLGNWSLGDYFKKEQLRWFFTFLTEEVGIDPKRLYVTVYSGAPEIGIPKDTDAVAIWKELFKEKGIEAKDVELGTEERGAELGMQGGRIFYYQDKNWWSRAGAPGNMPAGEPGGPDSEVFYEFEHIEHDPKFGAHCHPNCDCGRFLEVGNSVFMEYKKTADGFEKLAKQNVDFGGGLERIAAVSAGTDDIFKTDLYEPIIRRIETASGKKYDDADIEGKRAFRIIADHMRASVFVLDAGVLPSNTDQGYVLRRLLRRAVRYADSLGIPEMTLASIAEGVAEVYEGVYDTIREKQAMIAAAITEEEQKFRKTLEKGMKEFEKIAREGKGISGKDAFVLFTTYGFPFEMTRELAAEKGLAIDTKAFKEELEAHKELSRAGVTQKFKGGLADQGEMTVKYHTATHLMLAGLRRVLGDHVEQKGSNITAERIRFDFSHQTKMTPEELASVETFVNEAIKKDMPVSYEDMPVEEARASGAVGVFGERYGERVRVYTVGDEKEVVSKEICGGPHVTRTGGMGTFKILKEESVSAGVRRIKAVLEG